MKFKIGFADIFSEKNKKTDTPLRETQHTPRESVVQVKFPGRYGTLAYYNDRFDLRVGDRVYVDGKLEGQCGQVTEVSYAFKIKLSDYKRVIAVADTSVRGQFFYAGSYLIAFDQDVIPAEKVSAWFRAPAREGEESATGQDDTPFRLDDPQGLKVSPEIANRGYDYYRKGAVVYLSVDHGRGYAIVEGSRPYELEFEYQNGEIGNLTCSCFCSYPCKHEVAAMLQLKEILAKIEKHYATQYAVTGCFAAICRETLFSFAVEGKDSGSVSFH